MTLNDVVAVLYAYTAIALAILLGLILPHAQRPLIEWRRALTDNEVMAIGLSCICFGILYVRIWYAFSRLLENPAWMYQHWSSVAAVVLIGIGATIKVVGIIRGIRRR